MTHENYFLDSLSKTTKRYEFFCNKKAAKASLEFRNVDFSYYEEKVLAALSLLREV